MNHNTGTALCHLKEKHGVHKDGQSCAWLLLASTCRLRCYNKSLEEGLAMHCTECTDLFAQTTPFLYLKEIEMYARQILHSNHPDPNWSLGVLKSACCEWTAPCCPFCKLGQYIMEILSITVKNVLPLPREYEALLIALYLRSSCNGT